MRRPTKAEYAGLVKVAAGLGPLWAVERRNGRLRLPGAWGPLLIPPEFRGDRATPGTWMCTAGRNDGLVQYEAKTAREALKGAVRVLRRNARQSDTWADELEATLEVHRRRGLAAWAPPPSSWSEDNPPTFVVDGMPFPTRPDGKGGFVTVDAVVAVVPSTVEDFEASLRVAFDGRDVGIVGHTAPPLEEARAHVAWNRTTTVIVTWRKAEGWTAEFIISVTRTVQVIGQKDPEVIGLRTVDGRIDGRFTSPRNLANRVAEVLR